MNARRLATLVLVVTAGAAGWYFFAYLTRWEWNRAIVSGLIFVAAEIALLGTLALDRLTKLRTTLLALHEQQPREPRPEVLARIKESAPPARNPFAWLSPDRTQVFIPVLLGAGVIVSAIAWAVERIARATAGPRLERSLALRLDAIAPPPGGLLDPEPEPLALFSPLPATSGEVS